MLVNNILFTVREVFEKKMYKCVDVSKYTVLFYKYETFGPKKGLKQIGMNAVLVNNVPIGQTIMLLPLHCFSYYFSIAVVTVNDILGEGD